MIVLTNGCPVKIGRVVSENPNVPTPYGQKTRSHQFSRICQMT
jgi:hypothetical protein